MGNYLPGCRSGAVLLDGMENIEIIDSRTPRYGDAIGYNAHI
jgi:hypothetical protein